MLVKQPIPTVNPALNLPIPGRLRLALGSLAFVVHATLTPVIAGVALFSALGIAQLPAQTTAAGTVSGRIANAATGVYLGNAEVRIIGTDRVTTTSDSGRYTFNNVPDGEVNLSVSYTGLDTQQQ